MNGRYDPRVTRAALVSLLRAACGASAAPADDDTRHERVAVDGDAAIDPIDFSIRGP